MAVEPSLSELTNIHSEADLGTGDTGAVTNDGSNLVRLLNQTAEFRANQDREKYNTFLENLNGMYKDVENISSLDVAAEDRDHLTKQMNDVLSNVYKNPKDFFNNVGSAQGKELHKKLANWRMDAMQSKQDKLFDAAHREYIGRNPELNTDKNKANVDGYLKQPLGKRKAFTLDLPGIYDPSAMADQINKSIKQDYAKTGFSADGKFMWDEKGATYDPAQYRKRAEAFYYLPDKRGQELRSTLEGRFKSLPKDIQDQYKGKEDPIKEWYLDLQDQFRSPSQITKENQKANPYALETQKDKTKFALEDLRNRNDTNREIRVAQVKASLKDSAKPQQTKFLLDLASDVMNNTKGKMVVQNGKGNDYSTENIINASPVILKKFGKPIKKVTKDVLNRDIVTDDILLPDIMTRTADGGMRSIFWKKDKDGNILKDSNNNPVQESSEVAPLSEVMSIVGKDYMDKKSLPGAVEMAQDVLRNYSGDINKYSKANKSAADDSDDSDDTDVDNSGGAPVTQKATPKTGDKAKTYKVGGKDFSEDQLKKGAAKYKMSLEEYKKSIGIN